MIPQQLIHGHHLFQLGLKGTPIRFQYFKCDKGENLLNEGEHACAEETDAEPPADEFRMSWDGAPPRRCLLLGPHAGKGLLNVFEMQEEPKEELITEDCPSRDDKRERKFDVVVESHGIDG